MIASGVSAGNSSTRARNSLIGIRGTPSMRVASCSSSSRQSMIASSPALQAEWASWTVSSVTSEAPDLAVERVALDGAAACRLDGAHHPLRVEAEGRAGRAHDVLLDHDRAHVVAAELQGELADAQSLGDPRRLEVAEVVEVQAADGEGHEVVGRGGVGVVVAARAAAAGLVAPADEGAEPARLVLHLAQAAQGPHP